MGRFLYLQILIVLAASGKEIHVTCSHAKHLKEETRLT